MGERQIHKRMCIEMAEAPSHTVPVGAKVAANYFNGMLVRQDAMARGFDMGLMLDTGGFLAKGGTELVFVAKDKVLKTPAPSRILQSITRKSILEVALLEGIHVQETDISPEELLQADEIFTSSTPFKLLPAGRIEDRVLPEAPGPVTRHLGTVFSDILSGCDERFQKWFYPV